MRRTLVAVALATSLMTPAPSGLFDRLWGLFSALWDAPPGLPAQPPQTKEGCGADPDGRCLPASQPQTEAGCGADPNGLCHPGS